MATSGKEAKRGRGRPAKVKDGDFIEEVMDTQPVKIPRDDADSENENFGGDPTGETGKDEAKASSTKFVSVKTGRVFEKHPCLQCEKVFSSGRGVQMHLLQCKVSTQ